MQTVTQSLVGKLPLMNSRVFAELVAWPAQVPGAEVHLRGIATLLTDVHAQVSEDCARVVHSEPRACLINWILRVGVE